jgi:hypothetical protein
VTHFIHARRAQDNMVEAEYFDHLSYLAAMKITWRRAAQRFDRQFIKPLKPWAAADRREAGV